MANTTSNITIPNIKTILTKKNFSVFSGALKNSLQDDTDIFSIDSEFPNEHVKTYKIHECTEDLLSLSCAWYRLRTRPIDVNLGAVPVRVTNGLMSKILFDQICEEDRIFANEIRDYYSKKIMMWKLKDINFTKFRKDLNDFIHTDGKTFKSDIFGMVYRLPEFYDYDKKLDEIFNDRNKIVKKKITNLDNKVLNLIGTTKKNRKYFQSCEYWFVDNENNIVSISLPKDNSLLQIFEQLIQVPINLQGFYFAKKINDYEFYKVEKYNLVL